MTVEAGPNIVTSDLQIHLDAANSNSYSGSGTTWSDLSGNGRTFTWTTSPTFTSAGPLSYFSTASKKASGPASNSVGINNTSGYTIFVGMLQNTLTENAAFKFYKNNLTGSAGRGISLHLAWTDGNIYFDQGGCCNADTRTSVASGGTTTWNLWAFRRETNSSTRSIIKNASVLTTNTNAAATLDLDSRAIDVGGTDEYSNWNARLNLFIVYNRGLTDAEVSQNFNALRGRYGI